MITPSPLATLAVPVLEVGLPLATALGVLIASLLSSPASSAATRTAQGARAATAALVALSLVVATALWVLGPDLSASRWAELQLLWMAPTLLWAGLAAAVAAPRRHRRAPRTRGDHGPAGRCRLRLLARGRRSRVASALRLVALAGAGTGLSWFSALPPVQMLLLAPRQLTWPVQAGADPVPVGEWLELVLPALTTFHGRMTTWAPNRVVLLALGALACWLAWRRWHDHGSAGAVTTRGRGVAAVTGAGVTVGTTAVVVTACALLALLHPTQVATWRLGWSEGRLRVPVAVGDPALGTIEVSYQLHPATQAQTADGASSSAAAHRWPGAPVLVAAVGGPSAASQSKDQLLSALGQVGRTHDVLVSDYRGFGRSHPVRCPGVDVGVGAPADVASCQQRLGDLADHLSARASADDLEAVRAALGIDRWDLYGQSYGTFFAQTYAQAHPRAVRSMTLDSSLPLSGPPLWTYMADDLPAPADPGAWEQVVQQARDERWNAPSVGELALVHLYGAWPEVGGPRDEALRLPAPQRQQALARLGGDLSAQLAAMRADPLTHLVPAPAQGVYACNDFPMPFDPQQEAEGRGASTRAYAEAHLSTDIAPFTWREVDEAARGGNGLDVHTFRYPACLAWRYPVAGSDLQSGATAATGQGEAGASPVEPLEGSVPVLVVSGSLDTTTTPAMATQVAGTWGAPVLTVDGGDHFVLLDSSCARAAVASFVQDPREVAPLRCSSPG